MLQSHLVLYVYVHYCDIKVYFKSALHPTVLMMLHFVVLWKWVSV